MKTDLHEKLKEMVKDKQLVVHCDETTDRKGQVVFVTLFKILPDKSCSDIKLVSGVKVLSACNAQQCSQAILKVIFLTNIYLKKQEILIPHFYRHDYN